MNLKTVRGEFPGCVAPCAEPLHSTSRIQALALLLLSVLILLISKTVAAQEQPAYETGAKVYTDTMAHTAPRPRPVFTRTLRRDESAAADEALPDLAHAANSSDDFDDSAPITWWAGNGLTVAETDAFLSKYDARLTDIVVDAFSPYSFTGTAVQNTGAFKKTSSWFYGKTSAQVIALLAGNKVRLISLKAYDTGGGKIEFAGVTIANTGADLKTSTWYYDKSAADLATLEKDNPLKRFIAIDSYKDAGAVKYTAIMVGNTGANKVNWWSAVDASASNINTLAKGHSARVTYVSAAPGGRFNAVLEACGSSCPIWQWNPEQSFSQLESVAYQAGDRLLNVSPYPSAACGGSVCFAGTMLTASSAIATRVGNLIRSGGLKGTEGLYLEKISGPGINGVLANLEDWVPYEPASSIKALAGLYAMTQVQAGKAKLTTPLPTYVNPTTNQPYSSESCPDPVKKSGTEPLDYALREMLWHSDNVRTREFTDYFGEPAITAYAHKIGMLNTNLTEIVGCARPVLDTLTLDDAATLYAGVANQDLLNAENRGILFSSMAGRAQFESEGYDWTHIWDNEVLPPSDIPAIIQQVAPAGTSPAQMTAYQNAMNVAYKAGNYVFCQVNCPTPGVYPVIENVSISGWFQIPFCTASGTTYAQYVFGLMFSNEPDNAYDLTKPFGSSPTDKNFLAARSELMREQIAAGMASCKGKSLEVMTYSPADLAFGTTTVGSSAGTKSVTITNYQPTAATGLSVSVFGDFTETNNCPSSLGKGSSCTVTVNFVPTATGERTGAVIITDNGTGQPQTIELTGTGS